MIVCILACALFFGIGLWFFLREILFPKAEPDNPWYTQFIAQRNRAESLFRAALLARHESAKLARRICAQRKTIASLKAALKEPIN